MKTNCWNKYYFEGDIVVGFNHGITTETPIEFGCSRFEQIQYYIDEQNLPTLEKALMSDKEHVRRITNITANGIARFIQTEE